jgi:Flp pilus assembly protein CpaB
MRPIIRPRMSLTLRLLIGSVVFAVGGILTIGILAAAGVVTLPWMAKGLLALPPSHVGEVAVPATIKHIKSGDKVTPTDLSVLWLKKETLDGTILVDLSDVLWRVVARDKKPGSAFTADDFYPKGTRPGPTAAIPAGKRSLALSAEKLHGLVPGLAAGDRVDVLVTVLADSAKTGGHAATKSGPTFPLDPLKQALVQVIAENAIVLVPPVLPGKGKAADAAKHPEIVLALEGHEIPLLETALATNARISLLAKSGLPNASAMEQRIPNWGPDLPGDPPRSIAIDIMQGSHRKEVVFPTVKTPPKP